MKHTYLKWIHGDHYLQSPQDKNHAPKHIVPREGRLLIPDSGQLRAYQIRQLMHHYLL